MSTDAMRHAVLGAGGIGGLIGGALSHAGAEVVLLLRPEALDGYDGRLRIESAVLSDFDVECAATPILDRDVDVLWITPKATQLDAALSLAPAERVGAATVIPLMNGIEHMAVLRSHFSNVVAGAIRVESERASAGHIVQRSPFIAVELAGAAPVAEELRAAGIQCTVREDERTLLWSKLAFLGPLALATTALDGPLGVVRADARFAASLEETLTVARAEGAGVDEDAVRRLAATTPDDMRSSMQKDVAAGRVPELDAIGGAILRAAERHGIPVPATDELVQGVRHLVGV